MINTQLRHVQSIRTLLETAVDKSYKPAPPKDVNGEDDGEIINPSRARDVTIHGKGVSEKTDPPPSNDCSLDCYKKQVDDKVKVITDSLTGKPVDDDICSYFWCFDVWHIFAYACLVEVTIGESLYDPRYYEQLLVHPVFGKGYALLYSMICFINDLGQACLEHCESSDIQTGTHQDTIFILTTSGDHRENILPREIVIVQTGRKIVPTGERS